MSVWSHFHCINLMRKILRHGTTWSTNISSSRKYNLRLSTSTSIANKPKNHRAADPGIPGNNPCIMCTVTFALFLVRLCHGDSAARAQNRTTSLGNQSASITQLKLWDLILHVEHSFSLKPFVLLFLW